MRAIMPDAENPILDHLEDVRTGPKSISAMTEKTQVLGVDGIALSSP